MTLPLLNPRARGTAVLPSRPIARCTRALVAAAGLAGALATPAVAAPATVTVADDRFGPNAVSVVEGESVTWNFSESGHNVAGAGWSGNTGFGTGTFTRAFPAAGTFSYVCDAHSGMTGSVTVAAGAAAPAPVAPAGPAVAPVTVAGDVLAPSLGSPRVWLPRGKTRPRVTVRVSEAATLRIVTRRAGASKALPSTVRRGAKGRNRFTLALRGLRPGRYSVRITAADAAGNASRVRRATLVVPRPR